MNILILGAGNIGTAIAYLLQNAHYDIVLADLLPAPIDKKIKTAQCDIRDETAFDNLLASQKFDAVISSLPYFCNTAIAQKSKENHLHYFDLTEDVKTAEIIEKIANGAETVFIPHCGIAPGFINIAAFDLMQQYDHLDSVLLCAGALPQQSHNALHYALTWSVDGLINQYGNPCEAIVNGDYALIKPLEDREEIIIDGTVFEAFNTSGGLGSLSKSCQGRVNKLNYKTLRYPGHCEKIKFLMEDLHLNQHRDVLKSMLEETIPTTQQDVVIVYVAATGHKNNRLVEKNYTKKLYPATINNHLLTAIQLSTANSVCAVVDMILTKQYAFSGFVTQEQFLYRDFIANRFGKYYV